ncbi:hypothetical protein BLA60_35780 [Actinophytocola xinjiangensis]|uniref:HTH cro/C1-type domain-containing protein n=1 Tax=Actinophytocola xinjiangensis TaxID=485602 RepID=A0A7Z0WES1_9PSEU|nr:helix-turn-helix transcriptional regulator [Actinophytocola xinjiangensis]OLF05633.1 hypothetical protein BLA60_35780 [Actinophytocola xinjiangensis]
MAPRPGSTLRRRKLVKKLTEARKAAGLSIRQLAAEMDLQPGTVSKIETGKQGLTVRNIKSIGRATGLTKAGIDELVNLAATDDGDDDWLVEFRRTMPEWFTLYAALEQDAEEIWTYGSELVHGLVQTAGYAEALARTSVPPLDEDSLRRSVSLRIDRQAILDHEDPPRLRIVVNEAAIRRPVGGQEVMRAQLRHLASLADRPGIELRLLPFSVGAHPGMKSDFTVLRFPAGFDDMDCVYLENANGGVWQERPQDIDHYTTIFTGLRDLALPPSTTHAVLAELG